MLSVLNWTGVAVLMLRLTFIFSPQCRFYPLERSCQRFRQNSRFGHNGHEIGVRDPAGQHMHVDVPGNSRASGLADVHPQIDSIRRIKLPQNAFHSLRQFHHFARGAFGQLLQLVEMREWDNHHVPGGVWKVVEDDVAFFTAVDDQSFAVFQFGQFTKNAPILLFCGADVSVTPGSPKVIHSRQTSRSERGCGTTLTGWLSLQGWAAYVGKGGRPS